MRRFIFPACFIVGGIVLLLTKHGLVIRGTQVNVGWLVLGLGAISFLKSILAPPPPAPPPPSGTPPGTGAPPQAPPSGS